MASNITEFSRRVARNVKAELARADCTGADLIPVLDRGRNAIYDCLRGTKPFDANDIARIADFLNISVYALVGNPAVEAPEPSAQEQERSERLREAAAA